MGFDPEDLFIFYSLLFLKTWSMYVVIQCNEENGKKISILTFALIHLEMHSYIQGRGKVWKSGSSNMMGIVFPLIGINRLSPEICVKYVCN